MKNEIDSLQTIAKLINKAKIRGKLTFKKARSLESLPVIIIPAHVGDDDDERWIQFTKDTQGNEEEIDIPSSVPAQTFLLHHVLSYEMVTRISFVPNANGFTEMSFITKDNVFTKMISPKNSDMKDHWLGLGNLRYTPELEEIPILVLEQLEQFLLYINYRKLYAFETKSVSANKHKKTHSQQPVKHGNLIAIIYLDKPIAEAQSSKGGTHRSPKRHMRRNHTKTLSHPRYKNHPLYLIPNAIVIKEQWVGLTEFTHDTRVYTLIDK